MIGDILYNLVISPIETVIELIFSVIYKLIQNPGIAIIGVSLAVNFLVLPLYKKSDAIQEEEREKQKEMKPWLDHIKKNFKGDERYLMTQAYYRQQNYKPIYALRSSVSLLLQIPFFIAAFHYLSNLDILNNASFLIFDNLAEPDGLIKIGSLSLNLLPILMTTINIVSGAVYTRGFPIKEKLQLYGMALIFLVLLYNSPSGLVFYWTLNNIFSLCKNIVMKVLPHREKKVKPEPEPVEKKMFFIGTILLTALAGLVVPSTVINVSPTEFIGQNYGPIYIIIYTLSVFVGFFIVWFTIFYSLCNTRGKNIFTYIVWLMAGGCAVCFLFFGNDYGTMSTSLVYDEVPNATRVQMLINFGAVAVTFVAFFFLLKKLPKIAKAFGEILIIAAVVTSVVNIVQIASTVSGASSNDELINEDGSIKQILTLSKNGQNEIVFMLDRAISGYVTEILEEKPELKEQFDGFTYYPNTLSFGLYTNFCTPSLFGGYEYTPTAINERTDKLLKDENNESLKVLPALYSQNDFNVVVCDPPYAGAYEWESDVSIYAEDELTEDVNAYVTEGAFNGFNEEYNEYFEAKQLKNFTSYSIFRCVPTYFQLHYYDEGKYLSTMTQSNLSPDFMDSYTVLENLSEMTEITEDGDNFLMMQNSITHEPVKLLAPDYEPQLVTEGEMDNLSENHYCVNICSLMQLGEWFDYLREEGVYDNTRIIICSDHGRNLAEFDYMQFDGIDVECFNPLLLIKDFNATGFNISDELRTIADIPTIITDGVIDDPVNLYTGNELTHMSSSDETYYITRSDLCDTYTNNGTVFETGDEPWYSFKGDNIFDADNWSLFKPADPDYE